MTRREAVHLLSGAAAAACFTSTLSGVSSPLPLDFRMTDGSVPPLAPGEATSPERVALIDAFKRRSDGLEKKFEARTLKSDWRMLIGCSSLKRVEAFRWFCICTVVVGSATTMKNSLLLEMSLAHACGYFRRIENAFPAALSCPKLIADGSSTISRSSRRSRYQVLEMVPDWHYKLSKICVMSLE